jgi:uncharacterized protein involved in exopolysaccharide biosynthesis
LAIEDDARRVDVAVHGPLATVSEGLTAMPLGIGPGLSALGFTDYLRIVRKRKGAVVLMSFACLLVGAGSMLRETPQFRATAQVEIQALNEEFGYTKDVSVSSNGGGMFPDVDLATQVKVLGTRSLLDRVIAKLDGDPELRIQAPVDRFATGRQALHLPSIAAPGRRQAIEMAAGTVAVKPIRNSRVIEIQCDSEDPRLAALFANTLAQEYIEQSVETRWQSAKHTGEWLTRQLDEVKATLEKSEDQLQSYATSVNLVFSGAFRAIRTGPTFRRSG